MRKWIWLLWLAFLIECGTTMVIGRFVMLSLENQQRAAPAFTGFFFGAPAAWLIVPCPWLIGAALLSRRSASPPTAGFLFIGTLAVAAALVLLITTVAGILPSIAVRTRL